VAAKSVMQKWQQQNGEKASNGKQGEVVCSSLVMSSLLSAVPVMLTHHLPVLTCILLYIYGRN
jgi:hypothetical protein